MSLMFAGPGGSFEARWMVYAMLRDNVQHHMEKGVPSARFACLHQVSRALGGGSVTLDAATLAEELSALKEVMALPVADLAVSTRTRAAITLQWPPPAEEGTTLLRDTDIKVPLLHAEVKQLGDVCAPFVSQLQAIIKGGDAGATVEVRDL